MLASFKSFQTAGGPVPTSEFDFTAGGYTDAAGAFTLDAKRGPAIPFLRSGGGTMWDADGNLVWAPENIVPRSNDSMHHIANNGSVGTSINAGPLPGVSGCLRFTEDISALSHLFYSNSFATEYGEIYTLSAYLKKGLRGYAFFGTATAGFPICFLTVDLTSGAVSEIPDYTSAALAFDCVDAGNGWWRVSLTLKCWTRTTLAKVDVRASTNGMWNSRNYMGSTISPALYYAGFMVMRGYTVHPYIGTTAIGRYVPRFNHNPVTHECEGLLMEESRTNLISYSNIFGTSWGQVSGTVAFTQDETGPDGIANSAWTLTDDSAGSLEGLYRGIPKTAGVIYTASVFVKKTTGTPASYPGLVTVAGAGLAVGAVLNTTTGEAIAMTNFSSLAIAACTVGSDDCGDFWRVWVTHTQATTFTSSFYLLPAISTVDDGSTAGAATGTAVFYGAQLEAGADATSYIPTGDVTAVRAADTADIAALIPVDAPFSFAISFHPHSIGASGKSYLYSTGTSSGIRVNTNITPTTFFCYYNGTSIGGSNALTASNFDNNPLSFAISVTSGGQQYLFGNDGTGTPQYDRAGTVSGYPTLTTMPLINTAGSYPASATVQSLKTYPKALNAAQLLTQYSKL